MKRFVLYLSLLICVNLCAQKPLPVEVQFSVDSIKTALATETNELSYVQALIELSWQILPYDENEYINILEEIRERTERKLQDSLSAEEGATFRRYYAISHTVLAEKYVKLNLNKKALDLVFVALKIHTEDSNWTMIAHTNNTIASLYSQMGETQKAISYYDLNLKMNDKVDPKNIPNTMHNKAVLLIETNEVRRGLNLLLESNAIMRQDSNNRTGIYLVDNYREIGQAYLTLNNLDSAQYFYTKGMLQYESIPEDSFLLAGLYDLQATIYFSQKNHKKAIEFASKSISLSDKNNNLIRLKNARKMLYESYKALNNNNAAVEQLELFIIVNDSLQKLQDKKLALTLESKYDYESKLLADSIRTEGKTALLKETLKQAKSKNIIAIGTITFLIIVALLIGFAYQQKKKSNVTLIEKNALIEQSLKDKELFMKEIHHRVKNNMQMVSSILHLKSSETNNDEVRQELLDSQSRIHSMSLAHKKMYDNNNYEELNLNTYLNDIVTSAITSHDDISIDNFEFIAEDYFINVEQGQALGFIVHELALNSLKHAWNDNVTKQLKVEIINNNGKLSIVFEDNGKGLPEGFDLGTVSSMGLKLVRSFTQRQLEGKLKFSSENGTRVELSFTPRT
jgi:two-component sensor histidine kinase